MSNSLLFMASTNLGKLNLVFYLLSYANTNLQVSNERKRKHLNFRKEESDSPQVSAGSHLVIFCKILGRK